MSATTAGIDTPTRDTPAAGHTQEAVAQLEREGPPDQEWCIFCSREFPAQEIGMPRDVLTRTVEEPNLRGIVDTSSWDETWGAKPVYEVFHLDCGHTVSVLG